jgi:hypothetical protein
MKYILCRTNDAIFPVLATNYNNTLFPDLFRYNDLKTERGVSYRNIEIKLICNLIHRIQKRFYKKNTSATKHLTILHRNLAF